MNKVNSQLLYHWQPLTFGLLFYGPTENIVGNYTVMHNSKEN